MRGEGLGFEVCSERRDNITPATEMRTSAENSALGSRFATVGHVTINDVFEMALVGRALPAYPTIYARAEIYSSERRGKYVTRHGEASGYYFSWSQTLGISTQSVTPARKRGIGGQKR